MKKQGFLFAVLMLPALLCVAQKSETSASVLTAEQAQQVAKILRQHNVMAEYCGCCEKSAIWCVKINRVYADSIGVTVYGEDLETGERYKKVIDVAETWVPKLNMGRIEKLECVGQLAKVNCDPCTTPSVPLGNVGKKMLEMELDGLMEAGEGKLAKDSKDSKADKKDLSEIKLRKAEMIGKGQKPVIKPGMEARKQPLLKKGDLPLKKIQKPTPSEE